MTTHESTLEKPVVTTPPAEPAVKPPLPHLRIQPSKGWVSLRLRELWDYRELLYFMTTRDIKIRYKQASLGVAWAVLQPLMNMVVFTIFFGKLAKMASDGVPYFIWNFTALVAWFFFANSLNQTTNSVVGNANLVKKVYFPRLAIPIATVGSGLVDFAVSFVVLLVMMAIKGIVPTANVVFLPLLVLLALVTALGVGLWLTALNVQFRDVRFIVPFVTQFWMFATPVVYSSSLLDKYPVWKTLYGLNPMAGVVEGFRWALLGAKTQPGPIIVVSAASALVVLVSGAFYFRRMEKNFADIV